MSVSDVLAGDRRWLVEAADCLAFLASLPDDSVNLLLCSPPYEQARLYLEGGKDLGVSRPTEEWVAWMVEFVAAALRVTTGPVCLVVEGQTRDYRWSCGPALLMADLHRRGVCLRRPLVYRRSGIPGSGGPDYFRCDHEWIVVATRPGKLLWSDNTAGGHAPKWVPGGAMSNRMSDGKRVNAHGVRRDGVRVGGRRSHGKAAAVEEGQAHSMPDQAVTPDEADGLFGPVPAPEPDPWHKHGRGNGLGGRKKDGTINKGRTKTRTGRRPNGKDEEQQYAPPTLANPGTVRDATYTLDEVCQLLAACGVSDATLSDVLDVGSVGGKQMGSMLAHRNEAPYTELLCEWLVRSFCPPGGVVCDPFSGSGTTGAVAVRWGRRFVGCDLRPSQVDLSSDRIGGETPLMPGIEV